MTSLRIDFVSDVVCDDWRAFQRALRQIAAAKREGADPR
jgi:predicted DsbA family dithiol-disulfide isomerase